MVGRRGVYVVELRGFSEDEAARSGGGGGVGGIGGCPPPSGVRGNERRVRQRIEFRQRLYTVDELRDLYDSVGMTFERVFHGNGRPKEPTENQFEIFASARKG